MWFAWLHYCTRSRKMKMNIALHCTTFPFKKLPESLAWLIMWFFYYINYLQQKENHNLVQVFRVHEKYYLFAHDVCQYIVYLHCMFASSSSFSSNSFVYVYACRKILSKKTKNDLDALPFTTTANRHHHFFTWLAPFRIMEFLKFSFPLLPTALNADYNKMHSFIFMHVNIHSKPAYRHSKNEYRNVILYKKSHSYIYAYMLKVVEIYVQTIATISNI